MRVHTFISAIFLSILAFVSAKSTPHLEDRAAAAGSDSQAAITPPVSSTPCDGMVQRRMRPLRFFRPRNHP
ncbi:hypothetical protein E1B28_008191 [Marasmius oreades]|nr:uncharacterized protein E1B28_008191 [Marasmius oreades]KAG7091787.1 hypothetical protein E1B28_008191 [Marasmius oreades]